MNNIEKAANEYIRGKYSPWLYRSLQECFIAGAKWMEQQYKKIDGVMKEPAESKDEKIRKALLEMVHDTTGDEIWVDYNVHKEDALAWLERQKTSEEALQYVKDNHSPSEVSDFQVAMNIAVAKAYDKGYKDGLKKQGEQKKNICDGCNNVKGCVDCVNGDQWAKITEEENIKPKFKIGDFIVNDYCMGRVVEITNDAYLLDSGQGIPFSCHTTRLWDITKDAKDGDVLACGDKITDCPFIFHNLTKGLNPRSYCGVNSLCHFQDNDENGGFWCYSNEVRPATKEQRDLLFQKMEEAGYTWNPDEKKLEKIEQKSAWSEEDERIRDELVEFVDINALSIDERHDRWISWLEKQGKQILANSAQICKDEQIKSIESLRHKWSLGDSAEAKYKVEAYDELIEMLKEE